MLEQLLAVFLLIVFTVLISAVLLNAGMAGYREQKKGGSK